MTAATITAEREVRVIGLVTSAHFLSHFYQLVLPPMFPLLAAAYDLSFLELGVVVSVFGVATGLSQTPVGFLVDRFGARALLIFGLALLSVSTGAYGLIGSYEAMIVLALVGGIANSVFHPADFSILSGSVRQDRLGRAFGYHAVSGNLGWAAAPIAMAILAEAFGFRGAFLAAGAIGLAVSAVLLAQVGHLNEDAAAAGKKGKADSGSSTREGLGVILSRAVLLCFGFQLIYSMSFGGIRTFSVAALDALFGTPQAVVTLALSAYLVGGSVGNVAGGYLIDRSGRPALVFSVCVVGVAALIMLVGLVNLPTVLLLAVMGAAGTLQGSLLPARDLLVRSVAPPGQIGKVFGFVSSALGIGGAVTGVVFGLAMDHGDPQWVFYGSALLMLLSLATYVGVSRQTLR